MKARTLFHFFSKGEIFISERKGDLGQVTELLTTNCRISMFVMYGDALGDHWVYTYKIL